EVEEGKVHLGARVGIPDQATVVDRAQGKVHPPVPPGVAELVRRDGEGTEGGGGLALEEAEALRQLGGDEIAQGDVVDEDEEADVAVRVRGGRALRRVAEDHRHLRFEVEAPLRIGKGDVLGRSEEVARSSLVDEGIFPQRRRRLGAARLAHEDHVVEEGRAVHPLVRAGKRSVEAVGLDGQAFHPPRLQVGGEGLEPGRHIVPTIEGGLEVRRDAVGRRVDRVVPAHHDELSVAASIPERSEFHPLPPPAIAPSKANGVMTRSMKGTPPTNASTSAASARPVVKPCVQRRATTRTAHSQMKAMNPVPGRMPTSPGAEAYAAVRKVRENACVVDPTIRQATCSSAAKPQMPPTVSERAKSHLTTGETSDGSSGSGTNWPQPGKNSPTVSAHNQETTKPARETRRAKR